MCEKFGTYSLLVCFLLQLCWGHTFLYAYDLENQVVEKIKIYMEPGKKELNDYDRRAFLTRLKTKTGEIFSQNYFDNDLKTLSRDYDRIDPEVISIDGKIYITLDIWPNPTIRSIQWTGNSKVKTGKLRQELDINQGSRFDSQKFIQAFNKVKNYYIKNGFFEAELEFKLHHVPESNEIDILITVNEGRAGKIEKILFCHFSRKEQEEILNMMVTKKYNFFLSWITGEGVYNEEMIQYDKFNILNYLQNKGYADAVVEIEVREAQRSDRIIVCIKAERGSRYHFGNISIEGNKLFTDAQIYKCLPFKRGECFSPEKLLEGIKRINDMYGDRGYIEALVNYETLLEEGKNVYSIDITIEENEQYYVGLIKVLGNCRTNTSVILHESLLVPGEVFNSKKLQLTEKRLCNIGYFKTVNVFAVKTDEHSVLPSNYRDIHIEVEEMSTGQANAFLGYSTAEDMFAGINITERNFNINGLSRFWKEGMRSLRGAGEYAHITLQLGAKTTSYRLSWTKPYFMDTPWSVGFDLERSVSERISEKYEDVSHSLILHGTYDYNAFLRVGTHYRVKLTDMITHKGASKEVKEAAKNSGLLSALGLSLCYDSTNHPIFPTCGLRSRLEGEVAGLGGDRDFISASYLNSYFYDLAQWAVLKLRADFKCIQPIIKTRGKDMPLEERFYLGGDTDVRGYRPYRLGPKFRKKNKKNTDKEAPKGGISLQLFSAEIIKPLFPRFDAFIFFDSGALSLSKFSLGKFYSSTGLGCYLGIMPGSPPLTIGMGFPLNRVHSNDVKRFFISVGGKF